MINYSTNKNFDRSQLIEYLANVEDQKARPFGIENLKQRS